MGMIIRGNELDTVLKEGIKKVFGDNLNIQFTGFVDLEDNNSDIFNEIGLEITLASTPPISDKEIVDMKDEVERVKQSLQSYKDFLAFKGIQYDKDWNRPIIANREEGN
jgi:hypothetical protein